MCAAAEKRLKCTQCGEFLQEDQLIELDRYVPKPNAEFMLVFEKFEADEMHREVRRFHRRIVVTGPGGGMIGARTSLITCGPVEPYEASLQEQWVEWLWQDD